MRSLALLLGCCLAWPAAGQVTIDLRSLDALPLPGAQPRPAAPPRPRPPAATAPPPATAAAPKAAVPTTAPAAPAPPPSEAPAPQVALPIVTPPAADIPPAPGTAPAQAALATPAAPVQTAMQLLFAPAATELSADGAAALRSFAGAAPQTETVTFDIRAYAAGKADDPSVARRTSLSRALAVRSALIAQGVPSSRILVRALGAQAGPGPADRVDVTLLGVNATP